MTKSVDEAFAVLTRNRDELIANLNRQRKLAVQRRDRANAEIEKIDAALATQGIKPNTFIPVAKIKDSVATTSSVVVDKSKKSFGKIKFKRIGFTLLAILAAVLILAPVTSIPIIQPYSWMIWLITITAIIVIAIPDKKKA